ncbi:MAG: 50S ribosomal protein L25 [Bryobacteraceae bacterium]|jgi:large subunit ribosomal protein L25|nr:MAG: 50S ribosomal protein L25 [Bryobacteraceae bacterium]
MRKDITIAAEPRPARGKNEARRLRARMRIPAVVYGAGKESVAVSVSPKEIEKILHSSSGVNTIFNLDIQGVETTPVMVVDWQHDPVKSNLLHIDMKRIDLTKRLHVKVPVHTTGDPRGVKEQGGLHEIVSREIEIECLPDEIPEHFTVDVSALRIGQSLRAGDVPLSGTMKLLSPPDLVISHVVATRGSVEIAEGAEGAAAAEPEVVKKGKKEEEGAEKKK